MLGPAVNSGAGLFLYGTPGNGKTTIAKRITKCFGSHIWAPHTIIEDGQKVARWMLGDYEERYVRQNGTWLFQHVNVFMNFNIRADEGWEHVASLRPSATG